MQEGDIPVGDNARLRKREEGKNERRKDMEKRVKKAIKTRGKGENERVRTTERDQTPESHLCMVTSQCLSYLLLLLLLLMAWLDCWFCRDFLETFNALFNIIQGIPDV